jgi:hypothetical protein
MKYLGLLAIISSVYMAASEKVCGGNYFITTPSSKSEAIRHCSYYGRHLADINSTNIECLSKWVYSKGVKDFTYINSWNTDTYMGSAIALLPSVDGLHSTINVPVNGAQGPYPALCSSRRVCVVKKKNHHKW